jgi:DNA-binding SARP family transcriptional activator
MTCYNRCVLEFRILGSLEVLDDGRPLPLGGRNQRALLALLLLRANEPVSRERLVDQLWGERPPRTATTSLQNAVSQLRKLLGTGLLLTRPTGYMLQIDPDQLDLARFERLVREARASAPEERAARFRAALALWHGPALADLEQETFAQSEIQRLEDLRVGALEERIAADLEQEPDAELVAEVEALVRAHPLREPLRAHLMLALYRCGRQADALSAFHDARRTLVEELGIEPGPQLQSLYGAILRQERALVRIAPPALEDHYDEVIRAFSAGRLVPVLGPGVGGVDGHELATLLAERFELDGGGRGLAYVSQAVAARNGIGPLHDELHLALDRDFEPSLLHLWLASLPPLLRRRGLSQQLIVSTSFDTGVEKAFEAAGEELDVVVYVASGRDRGKFLHILPTGESFVVEEPNAYAGLTLEERSVLLKIHGHVDRGISRALESFAVSEDDHIDYLAGVEAAGTVPVQIAARLRRSHLLFLGYAVDDWSLRVFLRRVWGHDRLAYRSWAVQSAAETLARELWRERGVDAYDVGLDGYSEQLARVTAELSALDAAV